MFKVGDKVLVKGNEGIVVGFLQRYPEQVLIRYDKPFRHAHNGGGNENLIDHQGNVIGDSCQKTSNHWYEGIEDLKPCKEHNVIRILNKIDNDSRTT